MPKAAAVASVRTLERPDERSEGRRAPQRGRRFEAERVLDVATVGLTPIRTVFDAPSVANGPGSAPLSTDSIDKWSRERT
jgi:hypothetical protein